MKKGKERQWDDAEILQHEGGVSSPYGPVRSCCIGLLGTMSSSITLLRSGAVGEYLTPKYNFYRKCYILYNTRTEGIYQIKDNLPHAHCNRLPSTNCCPALRGAAYLGADLA